MRYCTIIFFVLLIASGCRPTQKASSKKVLTAVMEPPLPLSIDTIAPSLKLIPQKGYTLYIETIQIYIVSKSQPSVGLAIKRLQGDAQHSLFPHIQNMDTYSFGGAVRYKILDGEEGTITIVDAETTRPLNAKIVVSGYQQKNK